VQSLFLLKVLAILAAVILLIYFSYSLAKKGAFRTRDEQKSLIRIMEYQRIDNKCSICLVKAGSEYLLMAITPNHVSLNPVKVGNNDAASAIEQEIAAQKSYGQS
jgi:flagellar biogenesis protein FliO